MDIPVLKKRTNGISERDMNAANRTKTVLHFAALAMAMSVLQKTQP
jgi:hypothetical protein